ncbi:MAG TPA: hypothetical protein VNC59_02150, partial [Thermoanaerobaculia bacterium]|nr:hypothetical protein [Thermoanaerobaculia bacterium]
MALPSGFQLGPYVVSSPLGAGGMGEVYRARDTRLERDVAVGGDENVLGLQVAVDDPARVSRG